MLSLRDSDFAILVSCIEFHMWISFYSLERILPFCIKVKLLSSFQEEFFSTKIPWILTDQRSLHLTDIFNWQTSSLHLSTNRMTYRSPTSSTFVLNTGFITLKIYGKYQKRIPRKKRPTAKFKLKISQNHLYDRRDQIPRNSDYLLPIIERLFYWGHVGQNYKLSDKSLMSK